MLNGAIVRSEIGLSFQDMDQIFGGMGGTMASFMYLPRSMLGYIEVDDGRAYMPVMAIDPKKLAELDTAEEALAMQLVLYHETLHYLDWLKADEKHRRYFAPTDTKLMTDEHCAHYWRSEHDAYWEECHLAVSWGTYEPMSDLCKRIGDPVEFNKAMFVIYGKTQAGQHGRCLPVWAKEAGHPHWEAYK